MVLHYSCDLGLRSHDESKSAWQTHNNFGYSMVIHNFDFICTSKLPFKRLLKNIAPSRVEMLLSCDRSQSHTKMDFTLVRCSVILRSEFA